MKPQYFKRLKWRFSGWLWSGQPGPAGLLFTPTYYHWGHSELEKHHRRYFIKTVAPLKSQVKKSNFFFFFFLNWVLTAEARMRRLSKYRNFCLEVDFLKYLLSPGPQLLTVFSLLSGMSFLIRRQEENKNQTVSHNQKPPLWQRGLHRHQGLPPDRERLQPSKAILRSSCLGVWGKISAV